MTTQRTDVHSPTNMDPAAYAFRGAWDNMAPKMNDAERAVIAKVHETDRLGRGTTQCHHCGARLRYFAVMEHLPTGEYIAVGETCLDNRFSLESKRAFDKIRKEAAALRAEQRIVTAVREWLPTQSEALQAVMEKDADLDAIGLKGWALGTTQSIRSSLWRYGSLTVKQAALVERLLDEIPQRQAEQQRRESEQKVPAPEGKGITFEGTVIKMTEKWSEWGMVWKLLVKVETPEGIWICHVTEPKALDSERGDVVRMKANLTRSTKAGFEHFAFGKRPTQASLVERPSEAPEMDALDLPEGL